MSDQGPNPIGPVEEQRQLTVLESALFWSQALRLLNDPVRAFTGSASALLTAANPNDPSTVASVVRDDAWLAYCEQWRLAFDRICAESPQPQAGKHRSDG